MNEPIEVLRSVLAAIRREPELSYAEIRFVDEVVERLKVRDGRLESVEERSSRGVGVRVVARGQWGFASTASVEESAVLKAAKSAVAVAKASATFVGAGVLLPEIEGSKGEYATAVERDPFAIPLEEKLALLSEASEALKKNRPKIRRSESFMTWTRVHKVLLTTDGTEVSQRFVYGGAGMQCTAVGDDGVTQRRSFPAAMDGDAGQGGYERIDALRLVESAEQLAEEAVELLAAPPVPEGTRTVILESSQLALQVHESCGHPCELDRAYGTEISLAGGSFLQPSMLSSFTYGSPLVNLTADATNPGGLGTFGWDDEGTPAGRTPLVQEGQFTGYLSSRETAAQLGIRSSGSMRADGYARAPLIRMVNVNLEANPKGPTLEELIADTEDGLLIATNKSWSIDDMRLNFQFGCEIAWEIKKGKRTRVLRDPLYTGITPRFWRGCDAVCGPSDWKLWGLGTCGKGEPMQMMQVGHGAAPARFVGVEVGHG